MQEIHDHPARLWKLLTFIHVCVTVSLLGSLVYGIGLLSLVAHWLFSICGFENRLEMCVVAVESIMAQVFFVSRRQRPRLFLDGQSMSPDLWTSLVRPRSYKSAENTESHQEAGYANCEPVVFAWEPVHDKKFPTRISSARNQVQH